LKTLFSERTANKAILRAIKEFKTLKLDRDKNRDDKVRYLNKIEHMRNAYGEREKWDTILKDSLE
jgi:hypothetical protein